MTSAHDCSDGGLAVALAESCIAGSIGLMASWETAGPVDSPCSNATGYDLGIQGCVGEKDRIYGSMISSDIASELKKLGGHDVDKRKIELEEPIRELGSQQVSIKSISAR